MSEDQRDAETKQRQKNAQVRQEIKRLYSSRHFANPEAKRAIENLYNDTRKVNKSSVNRDTKALRGALSRSPIGRSLGNVLDAPSGTAKKIRTSFISSIIRDFKGAFKAIGSSIISKVIGFTSFVTAASSILSGALSPTRLQDGHDKKLLEDKLSKAYEREAKYMAELQRKKGSRNGRDSNYGPGSSPGSHRSGHGLRDDSGYISPVVLDLNRDGDVSLIGVKDSDALFANNDRGRHGWVAPEDGLLAIDADHNGRIDQENEIAFTKWDDRARTDLEGLALAFDSNDDGVFDGDDDRFDEFSIWRDGNSNGVHDDGEVMSLADAGISSIDVDVDLKAAVPITEQRAGNIIHQYTEVGYADGSKGVAGDVAFGHAQVLIEAMNRAGSGYPAGRSPSSHRVNRRRRPQYTPIAA
ncbi:MAG: hypothetical protein GDA50_08615 [Alphaproteobacteria bacterium GM202ARS2]|nr:hypothetical protein [Alphaproteobacteria bacterium GM202ARS2]